jgi:hypothetical protein
MVRYPYGLAAHELEVSSSVEYDKTTHPPQTKN